MSFLPSLDLSCPGARQEQRQQDLQDRPSAAGPSYSRTIRGKNGRSNARARSALSAAPSESGCSRRTDSRFVSASMALAIPSTATLFSRFSLFAPCFFPSLLQVVLVTRVCDAPFAMSFSPSLGLSCGPLLSCLFPSRDASRISSLTVSLVLHYTVSLLP